MRMPARRLLLLLAAVGALVALVMTRPEEPFGTAAPAPAVVGGVLADLRRYPYFCSFRKSYAPKQPFCGGVLIAPTTVLTARHCEINSGDLVRVGNTKDLLTVKGYSLAAGFDLAIVELTKASTQPPIKMASALPRPWVTPVTVLGRGRKTGAPGVPTDTAFTKATLLYVDNASANRMIQADPALSSGEKAIQAKILRSPTFLVAISSTRQACNGDSGGPLIIEKGPGKDELLGIMSSGPEGASGGLCEKAGTRQKYSVCASVPYYLQTRAQVAAMIKKVAPCKGVYVGRVTRDNKTYRCPKTHPWDTSLTDAKATDTVRALMQPVFPNQCAKSRECAEGIHGLYGVLALPRGPAVRYNPAA